MHEANTPGVSTHAKVRGGGGGACGGSDGNGEPGGGGGGEVGGGGGRLGGNAGSHAALKTPARLHVLAQNSLTSDVAVKPSGGAHEAPVVAIQLVTTCAWLRQVASG